MKVIYNKPLNYAETSHESFGCEIMGYVVVCHKVKAVIKIDNKLQSVPIEDIEFIDEVNDESYLDNHWLYKN